MFNCKSLWIKAPTGTPLKQCSDVVVLCSCTCLLVHLWVPLENAFKLCKNNASYSLNSRFETAIYRICVMWLFFLNISPRQKSSRYSCLLFFSLIPCGFSVSVLCSCASLGNAANNLCLSCIMQQHKSLTLYSLDPNGSQ